MVLPLVDMSVDQNEQALCDGLTEELSNWLAHIPTLRVVARTSAFAFKGTNTDVREIARQLGATHVVEGSLRRSGDPDAHHHPGHRGDGWAAHLVQVVRSCPSATSSSSRTRCRARWPKRCT